MVKCPAGTPSQVRANIAHFRKASSCAIEESFEGEGGTLPESDSIQESESELESNIADKRKPPTSRDELVYFFISCFMDILMERWEGKACVKKKTKIPEVEIEEYGEDFGPCELSNTSSGDVGLRDLYAKNSSNMSKEKAKEATESNESEYLNEEDFGSDVTPEMPKKPVPDEDVYFQFSNGVWYKGRVSRRLMEGEGSYFWNDGCSYQGEFEAGCITGKGRLEFPDLSVYEGALYKAFRHGEGLFYFPDTHVMYSAVTYPSTNHARWCLASVIGREPVHSAWYSRWQWGTVSTENLKQPFTIRWLGKKHGYGLIIYNEPRESPNYYKGQWQDGVKEGFGFRQYPSGARYVGFWSNGKRHGKGVMFWTNNDIYRGEWKEGLMHGYGEYTWNGFVNMSLSYPAANIYRGHWEEGERNGVGLFEVKTGCLIETVWVRNVKEGYGAVICKNGTVVASELLFVRDKPAVYPIVSCETGFFREAVEQSTRKKIHSDDVFTDHSSRMKLVKAIPIPINAAIHTLNLSPHISKFLKLKKEGYLQSNEDAEMKTEFVTLTPQKERDEEKSIILTDAQEKQLRNSMEMEESNLRNFIIFNSSALKVGYDYYSKLACEKPPPYKCILLRLFLWQLLLDGELPNSELSLVDIDNLLANEDYLLVQDPHDPFEKIQFWQFIQILVVLSWHLYGRYVFVEPPLLEDEQMANFLTRINSNCEMNNVLKTAFHFLIENIFWDKFLEGAEPPGERRTFEEYDFVPLDAMYRVYCNVGKPHSAREFVSAVCQKPQDLEETSVYRYFEKLPFCRVEGKNALTIAGELQHLYNCDPFNFPELFQLVGAKKVDPKEELTCFSHLGAKRVTRCLTEVCPGIVREDFIVNMNYQLTFLEFHKVLILCAKLHLKMKIHDQLRDGLIEEYKVKLEEYKKLMGEFEKSKESSLPSRRKSRQAGEGGKRGRK